MLGLALAGRSVHQARIATATPTEIPAAALIEITEFAPENAGMIESASLAAETVPEAVPETEIEAMPELVETLVAMEPLPMPPPLGAIIEALPEPVVAVAQTETRPAETSGPPRPPAARPSPQRESTPGARASQAAAPSSARTGASGGVPGPARLFSGAGTGRFPLPPYPAEAKRRGQEGQVMLQVAVGPDGLPALPRIESGSGHTSLDRAAVEWIKRRWRWESGPPRLFRIPIIFRLQ